MNFKQLDARRFARMRALAGLILATSLVACGSGSNDDGGSAQPSPPPPPPPPPASTCIDPTPAVASTVAFAAPASAAASSVSISDNGTSACFTGTKPVAVKSTVPVARGDASFHYFEARRSSADGVSFGVSASTEPLPANGSNFVPRNDALMLNGDMLSTVDGAGVTQEGIAGNGAVFGFAVDFRAKYPVVSVIGPASATPACVPLTGNTPCVLWRQQLAAPAAALYIYAHGSGSGGTSGPTVSINTGSNLVAKPFTYATPAVMAALRSTRYLGDRGFDAQWPATGGPATKPTLARVGHPMAVVRQGDATPFRSALAATPTNTGNGTIAWKDENGVARGSGASLALTAALLTALTPGDHTLVASVVHPTTGRYTTTSFRLLVLNSVANTDDDGDGLTYDEEKALGLDPGNADTDGDGLADGAETALGKDPAKADTDGDGTNDGVSLSGDASLPLRGMLVAEPDLTSPGLVIADDGLSVAFTSELNPDCVQRKDSFTAEAYSDIERCRKRAVRANVGIKPGEFRYFETRRFGPVENLGHGVIKAGAPIDPFCCFVEAGQPGFPFTGTPPSLSFNSVGGVYVDLNFYGGTFDPAMDLDASDVYGFAVDYSAADPLVYIVAKALGGAMTVSEAVPLSGFAGSAVMPMLYGHPNLETEPRSSINLGLQKFQYDLDAVRAALATRSANAAQFKPGVGIHRWQ